MNVQMNEMNEQINEKNGINRMYETNETKLLICMKLMKCFNE